MDSAPTTTPTQRGTKQEIFIREIDNSIIALNGALTKKNEYMNELN